MSRILDAFVLIVLILLLSGCSASQTPKYPVQPSAAIPAPAVSDLGAQLVSVASSQIGKPYRYGGADPGGFDCSGLVYFSHDSLGIHIPRTSRDQFRHSRRISSSTLRPGDLVFFRIYGRKPSHVGIYAGGGRFIHSPSSGGAVSYARLDNPYWKNKVIGAGRYY